ncbi:DUF3604 domain-containing protein [Fusobacterium sp.]|uniref:DUF3604 domain-containing protein n=1 Tax=Fusobacterium sp. TaxID=68766 RepID=UPI00396C4095
MKLLWCDLHANIHSNQLKNIQTWYEFAKEMTDFWPIAYYPFYMRKDATGIGLEDILKKEKREADWEYIREFVKKTSNSDYLLFMGYEWQGAGLDGDHNVFYRNLDEQLYAPMRYEELIKKLPLHKAVAIPHHLAYAPGHRGKNWSTHNNDYSPFVEIYSSHGSSESDTTDIHMGRHVHMGPRTSGTDVMSGLKAGNAVGIIASGDNHVVPAMYGHGLMACYAEEYTREAIFDAFLNRRVYGVTGSKTKLYYALNDNIMGSIIAPDKDDTYKATVDVECGTAIDRIEFIRNGIAEHTYVHNGKWENEELKGIIKFKFKMDFGWGPDLKIYPDITTKNWSGEVKTEGKIISVEKLWTNPGQEILEQTDKNCKFQLLTKKTTQTGKWMGVSGIQTEGFIFEVEADIDSTMTFVVNEKTFQYTVKEILEGTKLNGFVEEAIELAKERFGFSEYYRTDPFWHNAYKFKINQGFPEIAYKTKVSHVFHGLKTDNKDFFMVKIHQKNGEVAWASPVWVRK